MKKSGKRILTILLSIMIIMTYMVPGSVFADTAGASEETATAEVHEHDHAIEELSEGADDSDVVISDDEDPPVESEGEIIEEVPEAIEAEEPAEEVTEEPAEELPAAEETVAINDKAKAAAPALKAAASGLTVLAFTSDTHNKSGNVAANRLGTWIEKVKAEYGKVDVMAFGGDMANASANESDFWTLTQADLDQLSQRDVTAVVTTGNHEYSPGNYSNGKNNTTKVYIENSEGIEGSNYRIYCLGSSAYTESSGGGSWWGGGGWNEYTSSQITKLGNYLGSVDSSKVIVVITHYPLHYTSSRTITGAGDVIDALNTAANSGKKIVYLWGHNHTDAPRTETNYDKVFKPGDTITYSSGQSKEINFYYGAAGCMSDSEYGTGSGSVKGKGLVLQINSENKLTFTYYNADLEDVTEGGAFTEADPVAVTGVTVTPSTAEVLERKTVQLTAAVQPADATNKGVTWSSSDAGVATVDSKGLVKGVSEGTVTITATTADGNYTASSAVTVKHNENTSIEETVDITPASSNSPEENISINVGDTLKVNVTNGSSNSTYTFTATLSKNGVAQNLGESSVSIAAGATGTFTFEGIADGTVDITIQNSNSYGSQYARKGTIHLIVGEGGSTPVDPPTGDTVSITPTTDNPEESIKINVGDTLTINVTNGSSNSAYDFTATLANSSVAQIQGNSTVNIAAGGTGQFTVKGIANGTVDITIQNSNTYGSQYVRKGVIHLTVGEGGTTPVDPPTGDTVNITPTTDNPEESIKINVGETLTINVTNGSSNSAYDFTATLANSSVAQIQGNSTVNIAAGATGQFTVKGIANGTVDITIQNSNTYGSQYTRKGIIHLTVGEGTTPIEPPVGDTVTYQQADTLEADKDYIIVSGNSGSVYVLSNQANGSRKLKAISATVSGDQITLSASDAAKATFTAEGKTSTSGSDSVWLKNGSQYLYTNSADGLRVSSDQTATDNTGKYWHYKADGKNLLWYFKDTSTSDGYTDTSSTYKYYLEVSGSDFTDNHVSTTSLANSNTPKIYLFEKYEGPLEVTGVSLDKTALTLKVGQNETLTATVVPSGATNKEVTWSTSNANVATVDSNGKVTAVTAGTATITVTTVENSKTANCTVTVKEAGAGTDFVLTDKLEDGKDYLIANGNTGNVYIVSNEANGSRKLKAISVEVVGDTITIDDETADKAVFTAEGKTSTSGSDSVWLKNGSQYLYTNNADGLRVSSDQTATDNTGKYWHYKADGKNLLWYFKDTSSSDGYTDTSGTYKYYLEVSGSDFTDNHVSSTSLANSNTPKIYLFVKDDSTPQPHTHTYGEPTWNWTGNVKTRAAVTATATFTCTECGEELEVPADVASATDSSGHVVYTATVTGPDGKTYTDTKAEAEEGKYTITISADKTEVTPGDEVTFTITLGPVDRFGSMEMKLDIPSGLTYVADSFTIANGLEAKLGFDEVFFAENSKLFHGYASAADYESETDTVLATFKCTVDSSFTTSATVGLKDCDFGTSTTWEDLTDQFEIVPVTVVYTAHTHTAGTAVRENEVQPTCTTAGGYDEVVYCTGCGEEMSRTHVDVAATGHNMTAHAAVAATCTTAGNSAYWSCDKCGKYFSDAQGTTEIEENSWVIAATGHNMTAHAAVEATCTTAGNSAYWSCDKCGKYFSDAQGTTEIEEDSWVIAATGHDWEFVKFTWAEAGDSYTAVANYKCKNDDSHTTTANATVTAESTSASCETAGSVVYTATVAAADSPDKEAHTDTKTVESAVLGHDLTAHAAVAATCETAGNSAYWTCKRCGKHFSDAEGKTAIEADSWIIPATGHDYGELITEVAATCTTDGVKAHYECGTCHKLFDADKKETTEDALKIAALGHNMTAHAEVAATCTTAGNSAYWSCSRCGKYFSDAEGEFEIAPDSWVIAATGHDYGELIAEAAATCTADGVKAHYECSVCHKFFDEDKKETTEEALKIAALGHNMTAHAATAATCETAGNSAYWSCERCGKYFSDAEGATEIAEDSWEIAALGHDWKFIDFTWTGSDEDGYTAAVANYECQNDKTHKQTVNAAVTSASTAATCEEDGQTVYTATVAAADSLDKTAHSEVKTIVTEALGHDWGEANYGWSKDYSTVTAFRICNRDKSHIEEETVGTTYSVIQEPTEEASGIGRYTSDAFKNPAFEVVTTDVILQPTGYEITYVWSEDKSSVTATAVPYSTTAETITETVTTTNAVTTQPTCTEDGVRTYKAVFESQILSMQTETEPIAKLGHDLVHHDAKAATCTESGWDAYDTCSRCDYTTYSEIPAAGHNMTAHPAIAATCEVAGNSAYWSCSTCGKYFSDAEGATEIAEDSWEIAALGHDWKFIYFTWTGSDEDGYTAAVANYECQNDKTHKQTVNAAVTSTSTAATCEEDGQTVYTASIAAADSLDKTAHNETKTIVHEALGHDWGEAFYGWNDDNSKVKAIRTCKNDPEHLDSEEVETTSAVTVEPTCTAKGEMVYTATFTKEGFVQQTKTVEIDMIPHTLVHHEEVAAQCEAAGTAEYWECSVCKELFSDAEGKIKIPASDIVIPATGHTIVTDPGKAATCVETGLTEGSHCSVCGKVLVAQEEIPKTNHNYDEGVEIRPPVYTTPGLYRFTCTVCGDEKDYETGWVLEDEWTWRFLKNDGKWAAGEWINDNKGNCWIKEDGICAIDTWFTDPETGNLYYLEHGGYIARNKWAKDGDEWYYMNADGLITKNGWAKDSKGWCWLGADGKITKSKWIYYKSEWYYLKADGYMAANEWAKDGKGWMYMDGSGKITKSKWIQYKGEWYYLKADGYMAANEWAKDGKGWMYMDGSGKITKSKWIQYKGDWYYLKADGYMATGTQTIGGTTYSFDSSGRWIS